MLHGSGIGTIEMKGSKLLGYEATKSIDMREVDVIANDSWYSQANIFNYKNGIRDVYIGTERDPWAKERK